MKSEGFGKRLLFFLRSVALMDLALFVLVAVVVLAFGWRSLREYGVGLIFGGIAALLLGLISIVGNLGLTRSGSYQYAQSVGISKIDENVRQAVRETSAGYDFLGLMAFAGLIAFVVGLLVQGLG